jgi:hypothetical protein
MADTVEETLHGANGDVVLLSDDMPTRVCKIGQGAACCIFLVGGSKGMECAKFSSLANTLLARKFAGTMVANRVGDCRLVPEEIA